MDELNLREYRAMNRRELLKRLSAVPFLGVLVPVQPRDFDTAKMTARVTYGGFKCVNGHPWCNRCAAPADLTERSLERMCEQLANKIDGHPVRINPTHVHVRPHEMSGPSDFCIHCGASAEAIEDGLEPLYCWKNPGSRQPNGMYRVTSGTW
jgi:hypothetical protein